MKKKWFARNRILSSTAHLNRIPYYIDDKGQIIDTRPNDHALFAVAFFEKQGLSLQVNDAVEKIVTGNDYIRVQVFPDKSAFIQGTIDSLKKNGKRILNIVPDLAILEIGYVPIDYEVPPRFTRAEIERMNDWDKLIEEAITKGKSKSE